jgi:hypothetical protein
MMVSVYPRTPNNTETDWSLATPLPELGGVQKVFKASLKTFSRN